MVSDVIAGVVAVAAIASIVVGLRTYRGQVRSGQTQWLLDLRQRLLDDERFRVLRSEIVKQLSGTEESTALASAINKKRSPGNAETAIQLTDVEADRLVAVGEYLDFFGILEQLIRDNRLNEMDVFHAFNGEVDQIQRDDVLALELVDFPRTVELISRHRRVFATLHPQLVGTPRQTRI